MTRKAVPPNTVHVRVPASSANLGPGFDALGLALSLYDEVSATVTGKGITVEVSGEGAGELPTGPDHLVARAMAAAFAVLGDPVPCVALRCHNRVPQARGMGSSSAAIIAGIQLARGLAKEGQLRMDTAAALRLATEIEGHPDNVAACLLGGFTIAWTGPDGARAVRLEPAAEVLPVVFVPTERGLTTVARAALPERVPHVDASVNAGRAALLVHAMTAAPQQLFAATEDRLHQGYRASGMPGTAELVRRLRAEQVPAVVSGAGPAVMALARRDWVLPQVDGWAVWPMEISRVGATIEVEPDSLQHAEHDPVAAGRAS